MRTKSKTNLGRFKSLKLLRNESKHATLTRVLENQIRKMRHGERLPVVRDLMRKLKVSQNTIDHALAKLESRNLITRRWGSGIYVNRKGAPRTRKRTIGVVVSNITDQFCALLFKGIERSLAVQNRHAILCNGHERFQAELDAIHALHEKIDGVIINPTSNNVHNPDYVRYFSGLAQSREFPFLLVDIMIPGVNAHFAGFNNFDAFFEMAGVLAGAKKRFGRILYLGALGSIIGAERINGFKTGLKEQNISEDLLRIVNVRLPISDIAISPADLRGKKPALIVSASPLILPKILAFCAAQNLRMPEDVVITSVLEENFRDYVHAPILGWVKPSIELGELSARLIQALIAGKPVKQTTKLPLERFIPEAFKNLF